MEHPRYDIFFAESIVKHIDREPDHNVEHPRYDIFFPESIVKHIQREPNHNVELFSKENVYIFFV